MRSMDWTLEDNMVDGLFFCTTLTGCRWGHTPFVQAGAETLDNSVEAVKLDPGSSWECRSRVGAGVEDENVESCEVVRPLCTPLVIRPVCHTHVGVVTWTDELLCSRYKWVSWFEVPCICTQWTGERWVEKVSRLHGTACQRQCDSMQQSPGGWIPARIGRLSSGVASSHNSQGVIDGRVNEVGVSTAAPDRGAVLCGEMHQGGGDCSQCCCSSTQTSKAAITNHLHDHVDRVSIRQQSQQLAGEEAVPYSVVGCSEVKRHRSSLLSQKAILGALYQQVDLVYDWPPISKAHLLLWEQWCWLVQHKHRWVSRGF